MIIPVIGREYADFTARVIRREVDHPDAVPYVRRMNDPRLPALDDQAHPVGIPNPRPTGRERES